MDVDESLIPEELLFDKILNWLLFIGGIFQLICILAVFILPDQPDLSNNDERQDTIGSSQTEAENKKAVQNKSKRPQKIRKRR